MHLKNCIQCPAHESIVTVQSFWYAIATACPLRHWRWFSLASSGMAKMFDRRPVGADLCRLRYKKLWKATIVFHWPTALLPKMSNISIWCFYYFISTWTLQTFVLDHSQSAAKVWDVKVVKAARGVESTVRTSWLVMKWEAPILQVAFSL